MRHSVVVVLSHWLWWCVQLSTLRGSILEDCIPSTSKLSTARGLMPKDVLDYVVPGLNVSCLRYATVDDKTNDQLLRLDEQAVSHSCCLFTLRALV